MIKYMKSLLVSRSGNFALVLALVAPLLVGLVGGALDFLTFKNQQSHMQNVADSAALAAAREATVKNWSQSAVQALAETIAATGFNDVNPAGGAVYSVKATLDEKGKTVRVQLDMDHHRYFLLGYFRGSPQIRVEAAATVSGDMPICIVGLEQAVAETIAIKDQSTILADACAVQSNSTSTEGIFVDDKASLDSGSTCSAGGFKGSLSRFSPGPTTDCPVVTDPLVSRPEPAFGPCDHTDFKVKNGTFTIDPGVYCDGLLIDNNADVELKPGIYVIKGGEFRIRNNGSLKGTGVGFYFTGKDGRAVFDGTSSIDLSAPINGEMAGLLWFQDRAMDLTEFEISSKNASNLLGTIYLSNGRLKVHADNPIADKSAFTVIVARYLDIGKKAQLYINSGYSSTPVPVPDGLGPNSKVRLNN